MSDYETKMRLAGMDHAALVGLALELADALNGILAVASVRIDDPRIGAWDRARAAVAKVVRS